MRACRHNLYLGYDSTLYLSGSSGKEEIRELSAIVESGESSLEHLVGAYLLLDNDLAAELHLERLEERTREVLVKCPIYRFHRSSS